MYQIIDEEKRDRLSKIITGSVHGPCDNGYMQARRAVGNQYRRKLLFALEHQYWWD